MTKMLNVCPLLLPSTLWDCSWQICTNLSTCLLDCAFVGDATLCSIYHLQGDLSVTIWECIWAHPFLWKFPSELDYTPLSGDSAVFTQLGTSWSNQLWVNTVCLSMGRYLNQVVSIQSCGVSTDCRVSFCWVLANLHKCCICDM